MFCLQKKHSRCKEWQLSRPGVSLLMISLLAIQKTFSLLAQHSDISVAFTSTSGVVAFPTTTKSKQSRLAASTSNESSPSTWNHHVAEANQNTNFEGKAHIEVNELMNNRSASAGLEIDRTEDDKTSYGENAATLEKTQSLNASNMKGQSDPQQTASYLPWWAKKVEELRNVFVPQQKQICFVHIGKTAGSTMGCALGFTYGCPGLTFLDGLLPQYSTHVLHNSINSCPRNTSNYLVSVRNPLDRIRSAFVYERKRPGVVMNSVVGQEKIYEECSFYTLNDLIERGLAKNGNASALCRQRAYNHIRGIEQFSFHAFYNYQYYYRHLDLQESTKMFVVRSEHLIDDWNAIESMLGGPHQTMSEVLRFNPSDSYSTNGDHYLSEASRRLLCEALCDDIQVYKGILQQAVNLDEKDVATSYTELARTCPHEANTTTCSHGNDCDHEIESPYELRWPGYELPAWAKRSEWQQAISVPDNKQMCFVDIGKTVENHVGSFLGFNYSGADSQPYIPSGMMPRYTTHVFHSSVNDCPVSVPNYLISVRHPLSRVQAAHKFERPSDGVPNSRAKGQGMIYDECPFSTLNDLAELGLATHSNTSATCMQRAHHHIRGSEQYGYHMYFNYQYYYKNLDISNTTKIFVVRAEHLIDDWNTIEVMLGGTSQQNLDSLLQSFDSSIRTNTAIDEDEYFLSDESRGLLCHALCDEIQVYKKLLEKAVNLKESDVAVSLKELAATCPLEANLENCHDRFSLSSRRSNCVEKGGRVECRD